MAPHCTLQDLIGQHSSKAEWEAQQAVQSWAVAETLVTKYCSAAEPQYLVGDDHFSNYCTLYHSPMTEGVTTPENSAQFLHHHWTHNLCHYCLF